MGTALVRRAGTGRPGNPGLFDSRERPDASTALTALGTAWADRIDAARAVLDEYGDLELLNHATDSRTRTMVTLSELGDPGTARGNCWIASNELIDQLSTSEFEADELTEIVLGNRRFGGVHVAILASDRKSDWVVDYTIRQFDPEQPLPYVGEVDEWKQIIERSSGATWDFIVEADDDDDDDEY